VGRRAASYYARGEIQEFDNQTQLVDFLRQEGRHWAAFPTSELAAINRAYRRQTGEHLFVADGRSALVSLATNMAVEGIDNQNFLAPYVVSEPPPIQHTGGAARLEDKIEFLGYDIELPHGDYVGAGESFTITWYFRALRPIPGGWKMFVHVDGHGLRLNGDHHPVDEKYPVRLWDEGDVVIDRQELSVPANYRPGPYTIYMGFYSGSNRIRVVEGPKDNDNRVRAGTMMIR
jgi:hypothetical protein